MVVVALDTHARVKDLQAAGFNEAQAEAVTRAVGRGRDLSHLATRAELQATRVELQAVRDELKADLESLRQDTKADIESLRKDVKAHIAELKADILKWVIGIVGFQAVAIIGGMITVVRILRP